MIFQNMFLQKKCFYECAASGNIYFMHTWSLFLSITIVYKRFLRISAFFFCKYSHFINSAKDFELYGWKSFFLFFTLTPSLFAVTGWQTATKSVRVSVRVVFLPSHLPSPLSLTPTILPAGRHPACHGDSMGVKEAAVYRAYSYAALSVQLCCTLGAK